MQLTPGTRLRSQACTTEVIVVRGGNLAADLTCGGATMVPVVGAAAPPTSTPTQGHDTGSELGKRYSNGTIELLVTRPGAGTLAVSVEPLTVLQARQLPSSD